MAGKKNDSDLLAARMKALAGAQKPILANRANSGPVQPQARAPVKGGSIKRRAERKDTYKQATLISPTGETVQVVLKNLSETGARVDFYSGGSAIFGRTQLVQPALGLRRWARVVWKDQNSAGLEFEPG